MKNDQKMTAEMEQIWRKNRGGKDKTKASEDGEWVTVYLDDDHILQYEKKGPWYAVYGKRRCASTFSRRM